MMNDEVNSMVIERRGGNGMINEFITIRKAVLTDAEGIAKVHVDSWKTTYANIVPDEYLDNLFHMKVVNKCGMMLFLMEVFL